MKKDEFYTQKRNYKTFVTKRDYKTLAKKNYKIWATILGGMASCCMLVGCSGIASSETVTLSNQTAPQIIEETTTAEPETYATPEFAAEEANIVMVGDMLCHEGVYNSGYFDDGTVNFDHIFANTKDVISAADLAIVNQETMLGGKELGLSGYPCFNSPYEIGDALVEAGFDVVLSATNHTLDRGLTAIDNALNFWEENYPDIAVLGIHGEDFTDYSTQDIYVYEKGGMKVAILNYTYGTNGIPLPSSRPLVVNLLDEEKIRMDVERAKEMANFIIVCPHWGTEYVYRPDSSQEKWTKLFYDLGVDLVIGAHPHVLENVEWYSTEDSDRNMLVYYSLGNFVSNQDRMPRMLGGMADVTLRIDLASNLSQEERSTTAYETFTATFPKEWQGKDMVECGEDATYSNTGSEMTKTPGDVRGTSAGTSSHDEDDFYVINGALTEAGAQVANLPVGTKDGDELVVYIADASLDPLVCHKLFGPGKITTYFLSDYNDTLASQNRINADEPGFSMAYLDDLCEEILGDWYTSSEEAAAQ